MWLRNHLLFPGVFTSPNGYNRWVGKSKFSVCLETNKNSFGASPGEWNSFIEMCINFGNKLVYNKAHQFILHLVLLDIFYPTSSFKLPSPKYSTLILLGYSYTNEG